MSSSARTHKEMCDVLQMLRDECVPVLTHHWRVALDAEEYVYEDARLLFTGRLVVDCLLWRTQRMLGEAGPADHAYDGVAMTMGRIDWAKLFAAVHESNDHDRLLDALRASLRTLARFLGPVYSQAYVRVAAIQPRTMK